MLHRMQSGGTSAAPSLYDGPVLHIDQPSASEIAERYLRSLIFSGQLAPGDKLPSERELAAHFGIARITLRAALRSLEQYGFLVIKIGSKGGAWINDAATIRSRWEDWMTANKDRIREMLEFRRVVEVQIAALAAERRTARDLKLLAAVEVPGTVSRPTLVHWHFGFHDALAKAAHNRFLEEAMISVRGELFVPTDWDLTRHRIHDVEGLHGRILDAVREKDAVRAAEGMRIHLDISEKPFKVAKRR